ncbi:hypothetical protein DEO48_12680 [Enterobacter sp. CGMCC 5087]|uniref:hypothetical protein n=1 Tax=Enterobacter sp. CGMCC 5087 TaxID=2183878 RepID=UPI000D67991C|nr:hypothetical protein [Enterobacter sp. CGMCC 5087]PWI79697.1 hypothetical protein DEO48_12680 [Enterobacter sp. CGMCC 5087]
MPKPPLPHKADSLREVLFHLHAYDGDFVFTGRSLKELNQNLAQMAGDHVNRDIISSILGIGDFVIDRRRWFAQAIDDKYFTWIERDPLGGMFVWFCFLSGHAPLIDAGMDYDECREGKWTPFHELRLSDPESAEERLLSIKNMFDVSDISVRNKITVITEIQNSWHKVKTPLQKEFSFLLSKKECPEPIIDRLWDCAIEEGFPDVGFCGRTPESRILALPCMYYFWAADEKKYILNSLKTRAYRLNHSHSNKNKKTITARIDPEVKEKLDRILISRGVNIHNLLTHWIEKTHETLKK